MSPWKGDPDKPVVTVLCTAYNHEPFIRDALHGFLIQKTTFPFRVVVHDDASTDQTAVIVREYERRFPRIIRGIYQTTNLYSRKINRSSYVDPLIEGEFVAVCEGDDFWTDPRKLEEQARYLSTHPECSLVCQPHINAEYADGRLVSVGAARETALTLTRMYRKMDLQGFPEQLKGLPNGDRASLVFLSTKGNVVHLSHLSPAVRVMHDGGVMSRQPKIIQLERQVATWGAIYEYYRSTRFGSALREKYLRVLAEQELFRFRRSPFGFQKLSRGFRFAGYQAQLVPNHLRNRIIGLKGRRSFPLKLG